MRLYEIDQSIELILSQVDPETGEIADDAADALESLEMARSDKILNIAKVIKSLKAEADAYHAEMQRVRAAEAALTNRIEWLKGYILRFGKGEKAKDAQASVSYRTTTSVEVSGAPESLPDAFQRVRVEANKTALKEALEAGEQVDGAKLVQNTGVTIR